MPKLDAATLELMTQLEEHFLVPFDETTYFGELNDLIPSLEAPFQSSAKTFAHNLHAVISTATLPFVLAEASTHSTHQMRLHIAARLGARSLGPEPGESEETLEARREEFASQRAGELMREFINSDESTRVLVTDVCQFLLGGIQRGTIEQPAAELLLQGAALSWSAVEMLSRDTFEAYVNLRPNFARILLSDPNTKARFGLTKIPIDLLAQFQFDVSNQMGSILAAQQDFSNLQTIKATFSLLFPDCQPLREKLHSKELWVLCQQRHLIVHRRGGVDEEFRQNTGCTQPAGSSLRIRPAELNKSITLVRDTGISMLQATAAARNRG